MKSICKKLVISSIVFYRNFFSINMLPRCRFYPSCSAYAIEAVEKKGIFKGLFMSVFRILRCNPFSRGGYDPVNPVREQNALSGCDNLDPTPAVTLHKNSRFYTEFSNGVK